MWTGQHRPDVRELVERFYRDAWNRSDDAAEELLAPGFRFRGSLGDEAIGRDGFRPEWRARAEADSDLASLVTPSE